MAALPYVAARSPFRNWLIGMAVADSNLHVSTEGAWLGWFSPIKVYGLNVRVADGQPLLSIPELSTDRALLQFLFAGSDLGEIRITEPHLEIVVTDGRTNLAALQGAPDESESTELRAGRNQSIDVVIDRAQLSVRSSDPNQPEVVIGDVNLQARLENSSDSRRLTVQPATLIDHFQLSPALCDAGLKYVAPILADVTWIRGEGSLELDACQIELDAPQQSRVAGRLSVHGVESGPKNPLIREIAGLLARLLGRELPTSVRLADESIVQFEMQDGRVTHRGLAFGLPEISPELQIRTHGSVGLEDETLDLMVEIPLPFHLLGDGPIAKTLGSQTIQVPIRGTLENPQIEFRGDGQFVSDVFASLGTKLTDDQSTVEDLTEQLRSLGGVLQDRLNNWREDRPLRQRMLENQRTGRGLFGRLRGLAIPDESPETAPAETAPGVPDENERAENAPTEGDDVSERRRLLGRSRILGRRRTDR